MLNTNITSSKRKYHNDNKSHLENHKRKFDYSDIDSLFGYFSYFI